MEWIFLDEWLENELKKKGEGKVMNFEIFVYGIQEKGNEMNHFDLL